MGAFYGSIQVRTEDRESVLAAADTVARATNIKCLVAPPIGGWVAIFPDSHGQDARVGADIARKAQGFVLQLLLHDDDVMVYWLWRDGKEIDSYFSHPGYFGEEEREIQARMKGNARAFLPIVGESASRLESILDRDDPAVEERQRFEEFASLLGIANAATSYEYLKQPGTDRIKGGRGLTEVPIGEAEAEKSRKASQRKQERARIKGLIKEGVLFAHERRNDSPDICNSGDGFVVVWPRGVKEPPRFQFYAKPWTEPDEPPVGNVDYVDNIAASDDSRRVLVCEKDSSTLWAVAANNWQRIWTRDVCMRFAAFSLDGRRILHVAERSSIVVADTENGLDRGTFPFSPHGRYHVALHPTSEWVATGSRTLTLIPLRHGSAERSWCVGGEVRGAPHILARREYIEDNPPEKLEKEFRKAIEQLRIRLKSSSSDVFEDMRKQMEQRLADAIAQWEALQKGELETPPEGAASIFSVGFSRDGRFLWCGTTKGVRVYAWPAILGSKDLSDPPVVWQFQPPDDWTHSQYIHALAEEREGDGLLFGGLNGCLYRMDLSNGSVRQIMALPDERAIQQLCFSADGLALGMVSYIPGFTRDYKRRPSYAFVEIWSYPGILDRRDP